MSRTGNKWNVNECLELQREYELLEMTVPEIAVFHQRTELAIVYKLYSEGFIPSIEQARGYIQPEHKKDDIELSLGSDDDSSYVDDDDDDSTYVDEEEDDADDDDSTYVDEEDYDDDEERPKIETTKKNETFLEASIRELKTKLDDIFKEKIC